MLARTRDSYHAAQLVSKWIAKANNSGDPYTAALRCAIVPFSLSCSGIPSLASYGHHLTRLLLCLHHECAHTHPKDLALSEALSPESMLEFVEGIHMLRFYLEISPSSCCRQLYHRRSPRLRRRLRHPKMQQRTRRAAPVLRLRRLPASIDGARHHHRRRLRQPLAPPKAILQTQNSLRQPLPIRWLLRRLLRRICYSIGAFEGRNSRVMRFSHRKPLRYWLVGGRFVSAFL